MAAKKDKADKDDAKKKKKPKKKKKEEAKEEVKEEAPAEEAEATEEAAAEAEEAPAEDIELTSEKAEEGGEKKKSKLKLIIIIASVVLILVIGLGVGAMFMFSGESEKVIEPAVIYQQPKQPFVVRFNKKERFSLMRINFAYVVRGAKAERDLHIHQSMVRHEFLLILANQNGNTLLTLNGKDALIEKLKTAANRILMKYGKPSEESDEVHPDDSSEEKEAVMSKEEMKPVEKILITEFVMQ